MVLLLLLRKKGLRVLFAGISCCFLPQTGYYLLPLMHVLCVFQACLAGLLTDIMEYKFLPCLLFVNPISFPGNHVPFLCGKLVMNPFLIVL